MNVRPILFSGPMVRALLEGRKTQTRRPVVGDAADALNFIAGRADDSPGSSEDITIEWVRPVDDDHRKAPKQWCAWNAEYREEGCIPLGIGYGRPGDLLWVRETVTTEDRDPDGTTYQRPFYRADVSDPYGYCFTVDGEGPRYIEHLRWTPSIHMPRWASRITLEITQVWVQRLQEIGPSDAAAEGVPFTELPQGSTPDALHVAQFADLWEETYGDGQWEENPWVWGIAFKVHKANIDEFLKARAA